jgi:hypothetical protein
MSLKRDKTQKILQSTVTCAQRLNRVIHKHDMSISLFLQLAHNFFFKVIVCKHFQIKWSHYLL